MADVSIMCSNCAMAFKVSEYALGKTIRCPTCNTEIKTMSDSAQDAQSTQAKSKLKLAHRPGANIQQPNIVESTKEDLISPEQKKIEDNTSVLSDIIPQNQPSAEDKPTVMAVSGQDAENIKRAVPWGLLIVLIFAPIMAILRYGEYTPIGPLLPDSILDSLENYGAYILIFTHLVIVILAFGDSVMEGILCVLVPFFSFYYILANNDRNIFRAFLLVLIIFLALDTYNFSKVHGATTYKAVKHWLETASI